MKNQVLVLITTIGLIMTIVILAVSQKGNQTNVYCSSAQDRGTNPSCKVEEIPESIKKADDVMLYYKIDDNCNLQTLVFDPVYENPFTIVGRFTGRHLENEQYELSEIFTRLYGLGSFPDALEINQVKLLEKSNPSHVYFGVEVVETNNQTRTGADYIFKEKVVLNKDAYIDFVVILPDSNNSMELELSSYNFTGGGYECNGQATTGG